jgi:chemotaxis protein CheY-P-specific phosphatase CheC
MCSAKLPDLFTPDLAAQVAGAIASVAEKSFYAEAEPCDRARFDELLAGGDWLVATVHFREGACAGALTCTVPHDLARTLLDAFTGRDPLDPEPDREALFDLVGELSNMICGTWLTRMATAQAFTLSRPVVETAAGRPSLAPDDAMLMKVNDLPLAVSVRGIDTEAAAAGF